MTIENALLKSAEANEKLADAMNRYSDVLLAAVEGGVSVAGTAFEKTEATTDTKAPTAAEKKAAAAAEKKAAKEAAEAAKAAAEAAEDDDGLGDDDDDGFGDDEASEKTYTTADIRELILKVRDIGGEKKNAAGAKKVLATLGVKSMSEISEDMYGKAAELCLKALK